MYSYNCCWALPEQSLSGPTPAELTTIFYSLIWDSLNLQGQIPVFIFPWNREAQLYPRALSSLSVVSYDLQGWGGGILTRLHTGLIRKRVSMVSFNPPKDISEEYFKLSHSPLFADNLQFINQYSAYLRTISSYWKNC
jgi:hypothetical protein